MFLSAFLFTNYARGQDFIIHDSSLLIPDSPTPFLQSNPYPTSLFTSSKLEVGKSFVFKPTRGVFYGGNLGVSQNISNYGHYLGKWSFTGAWQKKLLSGISTNWVFTPGVNYLVNYHRWGDYAAHFGLRATSTTRSDVFPEGVIYTEAPQKDAVITWGYETGAPPNRLIFQTIEGVDTTISKPQDVEHEWATILSNGNFGIGISNPDAQFTVKNNLSTYSLIKTFDGTGSVPFEIKWNGGINFNKVVNPDGITTNLLQVMPNGTLTSTPFSGLYSNINWSQTGNLLGVPTAKLGSTNPFDYEFISNGSTFLLVNGDQAKNAYQGFTNFTKNMSISGGNTSTGLPNGGYKINDPSFSLTVKSSIMSGYSNYIDKGILNCIDIYNSPVLQVGNQSISIFNSNHQIGSNYSHFNGYVDFNGDISVGNLFPYNSNSTLGSSSSYFYDIYTQYGHVGTSDIRLKEDITPLVYGLKTVLELKPYSYHFIKRKDNFYHHGFIAQDLKNIFPNSIWAGSETDSTFLGVRYSEFIPILTKAIQEQQAIIDTLKQKLELIFASGQIKDSKIINTQNEILNQLPLLFQNHPNPFNEKTLIDYFIPETTSSAFLKVTDINGKIVKVFQISKSGFGQVELDCSNLAIGKYFYSLIVNTQVVDTKAMFIKRID